MPALPGSKVSRAQGTNIATAANFVENAAAEINIQWKCGVPHGKRHHVLEFTVLDVHVGTPAPLFFISFQNYDAIRDTQRRRVARFASGTRPKGLQLPA